MKQKRKITCICSIGGILVMTLMLFCAFLLCVTLGSTRLSPTELIDGLLGKPHAHIATVILYYLRLPRVFAALLAGVGLSIAGVLLQSVASNELAAPNIIGVNSGAGFCCILLLTFLPQAAEMLPIVASLGAFGTTLLIVSVASRISAFRGTV
ncbi:MAG: iron chelate uptake ABC transporter family permease subunit, partial [Clostridia bacterium]|nr:iron chelate uptake ABC transporter family permease subunit [Clostridia bacterium]